MSAKRRTGRRPVDRAIAYLRVSKEEQNLGPDAQRAAIATWAKRTKVKVLEFYEDHGVSGATPVDQRPELLRAFQAIKLRHAGLLVVARRDRLARSVFIAATIEHLAERAGARVVSADGTTNEEGPEADLLRSIIDAFAAYERAMIIARTKGALAAKKRKGERTGSIPFGYKVDEAGKLLESREEQRAIARIVSLRHEGLSLARIAKKLEADGYEPRGQRWHRCTLERILAR